MSLQTSNMPICPARFKSRSLTSVTSARVHAAKLNLYWSVGHTWVLFLSHLSIFYAVREQTNFKPDWYSSPDPDCRLAIGRDLDLDQWQAYNLGQMNRGPFLVDTSRQSTLHSVNQATQINRSILGVSLFTLHNFDAGRSSSSNIQSVFSESGYFRPKP